MTMRVVDGDLTAFTRTASGVGVDQAASAAEAHARLRRTGERATVVFDHGEPLGIVTADRLGRALLDGNGDTPVGLLVDYVAVRVVPPADAQATLAAFTRSAWDWLCRRSG